MVCRTFSDTVRVEIANRSIEQFSGALSDFIRSAHALQAKTPDQSKQSPVGSWRYPAGSIRPENAGYSFALTNKLGAITHAVQVFFAN